MAIQSIYLAGGCFWGTQKFFDQFPGVVGTQVGYANGQTAEPSYREVCAGSGHAETVRIDYDEERISLEKLLDYYFTVIDPTAYHRQGPDTGIQYRTGIYYTDAALLPRLEKRYAEEQSKYRQTLETELLPLEKDLDILRNIPYSGVWQRYVLQMKKRYGKEVTLPDE